VRLEGLGKLKKKNPPHPGLEPATFQLVALCLNQLRYRVPPRKKNGNNINMQLKYFNNYFSQSFLM
jgi:hypothetical protein